MLVRSLERTGGPEEEGVRMFKDELRETVLLKESNRLGDFAENNFYLVSTLLDPRSLLNLSGFCQKKFKVMFKMNIWITYRYKDSFFLDPETAERGRQALVQVVEAEYEALGGNNNVQVEVGEEPDAEEGSSSILQSMRKRICRDRERHVEVTMILLWEGGGSL